MSKIRFSKNKKGQRQNMKGNSHLKVHHVFTIVAFDVCLLTRNGSESNASSVFPKPKPVTNFQSFANPGFKT